jgi:hypothetical protein
MRLGDPVLIRGRMFVLRGVDPMSVPDRQAEVEDPRTGERFTVPCAELEEPEEPPRAAAGLDPVG